MKIKQSLDDFAAQSVNRFPPELIQIMQNAAANLKAQGIGNNALKAGDVLPNASLTAANGDSVEISELLKAGPLIISFYRGGWCPYCNIELKGYQNILGDIHAAGAQLVAITPEKPDNSLSTIEKNQLSFPVLTDSGNNFAKQLGIVFEIPADLQKTYTDTFKLDLSKVNEQSAWTLPIPATFVVSSNGTIVLADVNRDYTKRLEPTEALDALNRA